MLVSKPGLFFANILVGMAWFWLFNMIGWITITEAIQPLVLAIFVIALIGWLVKLAIIGVFIILTAALASCEQAVLLLILLVIVFFAFGWFTILGLAALGLITVNVQFFGAGFLMSLAYGLIQFSSPSSK